MDLISTLGRRPAHLVVATGALCCILVVPGAASAKVTAEKIYQRVRENWVFRLPGAEGRVKVLLRDPGGAIRKREVMFLVRRRGRLADVLLRVTAPGALAGTAFLTLGKKGSDDIYYYMPALKATRRLVGAQKNQKFLGSEVTLADLEFKYLEHSKRERAPDEKIGKTPCYVLKAVPNDKTLYFSRYKIWARKGDFAVVRMRFWNGQGGVVKTDYIKAWKRFGPRVVPLIIKSVNHRTKRSSMFVAKKVWLRSNLSDQQFSLRQLGKAP